MIYNQIAGVAMGSSLAPVLANIFMGFHESKWLNEYNLNKPKFYLRYVDGILAAFDYEQDSLNFLNFLNNKHLKGTPNSQGILNWIIQILHYCCRKQHTNIKKSQIIGQNVVTSLCLSLRLLWLALPLPSWAAQFFQFLDTVTLWN